MENFKKLAAHHFFHAKRALMWALVERRMAENVKNEKPDLYQHHRRQAAQEFKVAKHLAKLGMSCKQQRGSNS